MDTSIIPSLDLRRRKKDGTYPLVLRLGHKQSTTTINLKISLPEKDWDAKNHIVRKTYKGSESVTRLNNMILSKRASAMEIIMGLYESGLLNGMTIADLREKIVGNKHKSLSFFKHAEEQIEQLKKANRFGTARSYQGAINIMRNFSQGKDLQFQDVNYKFLMKFETHHASKGNSPNGLAVYMRSIRALYNKAIKSGVIDKEFYPFEDYKVKTIPTEKRSLEWSLLKKIIEKEIKPDHECFNARNYFVCSYMMYGMNFTDMAFLKVTDVKDGRIQYRRKKTSKLYDIKLNKHLEGILAYYIKRNPNSDFIFPILKREESSLQYKDILWARKRYNKQLKLLAKLCEIDANLTSYVSRHSFATQAMLQQVPLNAISSMLGHSSLKTTEIYLKSLPSNALDDYNEKIMQG